MEPINPLSNEAKRKERYKALEMLERAKEIERNKMKNGFKYKKLDSRTQKLRLC